VLVIAVLVVVGGIVVVVCAGRLPQATIRATETSASDRMRARVRQTTSGPSPNSCAVSPALDAAGCVLGLDERTGAPSSCVLASIADWLGNTAASIERQTTRFERVIKFGPGRRSFGEIAMSEAVIVATARSPIGRAYKGSLIEVRADDLAGFAINAVMEKVPEVDRASVVDVMVGCGLTHHEQGFNLARPASLLGGMPDSVPATTVNRFCASSLQTIRMAFHAIKQGEGDAYVAAGSESVTRTYGKALDSEDLNPRFTDPSGDDFIDSVYIPMGNTAENVAERYGISRDRMDEFAKRSQDRAVEAQTNGFFDREITPIEIPDGRIIHTDDGPRSDTSLEKLASLPPVFKTDGRVTAGNSCPLNDGSAAVLVMSEERAASLGLKPLARIIASSVVGLEPEYMGMGPVGAVRAALDQAGMNLSDVDVIEINEAFAAQVLACVDELGIEIDKLNPNGGAIALGHPFGMTGARIMGTLINDLRTMDKTVGLETMCVGGGQGMAMIVERVG
jgi:acetyl-CoA C-acetyltransferase